MKNIYSLVMVALASAISIVPMLGKDAQNAVERAALPPRQDRDRIADACGLKGEDRATGERLLQRVADAISDCVCFYGSGGRIKPD